MSSIILFNSSTPQWAWLSNFSAHEVCDRHGRHWRTAEHAYQACKTADAAEREAIAAAPSPQRAKALGRGVTLRRNWGEIKLAVMSRILHSKFTRDRVLRERLLSTQDAELVHDCPWGDTYWGVCRGTGSNHLGRLLMELHSELLGEEGS